MLWNSCDICGGCGYWVQICSICEAQELTKDNCTNCNGSGLEYIVCVACKWGRIDEFDFD